MEPRNDKTIAFTVIYAKSGETVWAYQTEADPTGISDVNIEPTTDNRYFDLQGRNIAPSDMKRGIYIINGKKVIVNNR